MDISYRHQGNVVELVNTLGIGIVGSRRITVREWQARLLMGSGKAQELLDAARASWIQ